MKLICTRPECSKPDNDFADLDDPMVLSTAQQKFCRSCGMPLMLRSRYLPSRILGQGGFGSAFLAIDRDSPTKRECVVKLFQPSLNLTPDQVKLALELFEREAIELERLGNRHKQIPNLFAYFPLVVPAKDPKGPEEQYFYLVQEFIDGQDLEKELAQKHQLTEQEVTLVLKEMLGILKFVHQNNCIHRDIKPSNIIRDRQGVLFLLDFGAVKQLTTNVGARSGRSTGIYSPGYAPPEQMAGSTVYEATDIYALGVTCITLLTGKPPEELYDSFTNNWSWHHHVPNLNDRLQYILDRMVIAAPKDRFQSADMVLSILRSSKTSQSKAPTPQPPTPIASRPPSPAPTPSNPGGNITPAPTPSRPAKFSTLEGLFSAGFAGFEGFLLYTAATSLLPTPAIAIGVWGMAMGGMVYGLYRKLIEGKDLPIFAILSLLLMAIPLLRGASAFLDVAMFAFFAGAAVMAVTSLFSLIYRLLKMFI